MLYLKACPRCDGDVHVNQDNFGEYRECLQCGYMVDTEPPVKYRVTVMAKDKPGRPSKVA